jgi:hypothetical protein
VTSIRSLTLLACFGAVCLASEAYGSESRERAKLIFRRLTGGLIYDGDPRLEQMTAAVQRGAFMEAAKIASSDRYFLGTTVRNWSSGWTSIDASSFGPFNDAQALGVGLVRDRDDIRKVLVGDVLYEGRADMGFPRNAPEHNRHFVEIEKSGVDLGSALITTQSARKIGVFGTRGFAQEYYAAGTNRRAVKFALKNFLCKDITNWREPGLPDDFVRRDVDRMPSGSFQTYQTDCRGCHAPMDALSGAFAYSDFSSNRLVTSQSVLPKYNQNTNFYPDGYVVSDGSWVNYLAHHQQSSFGWRGPTEGSTLEEFGTMLANSRAFSECMVRQAFQVTCRVFEFTSRQERYIKTLADTLEANSYDMRNIFELIAISDECK